MPDFAPGIPDKSVYGDPTDLSMDEILPWVIQEHKARKAGLHKDIRFGKGRMYSFATKKPMPAPGEKINLYQTPLHRESYMHYQGSIPEGTYGAGSVKPIDKGEILITSSKPGRIVFVTAHKQVPERFALIKSKKDPKTWLFANITPGVKDFEKVKYTTIPADKVEKVLGGDQVLQPKVDGALTVYNIVRDKIDAVSYRTSKKTGGPILHTERLGLHGVRVPEELHGTQLQGEAYGVRGGKAIPVQTTSGLFNSAVAKSIRNRQRDKIELRNMLFNVSKFKGREVPIGTPYAEKEKMLQEVMQYLPADKFHLPPTFDPKEVGRRLAEMQAGKYPLTSEGIVAHPKAGGVPKKLKLLPEDDISITSIFPGAGKYKGIGAGGFGYSVEPGGPEVGKVGTGLSDELRQQLLGDPEEYIGRVARIRSMGRFPSGAHRAPSFIALHEDYPAQEKRADSEAITTEDKIKVIRPKRQKSIVGHKESLLPQPQREATIVSDPLPSVRDQ